MLSSVAVAARILAMLSVEGQRGRPSAATRFERLKVVASRPAFRASPDALSRFSAGSRSIACQIRSWDSTSDLRPDLGERNKYLAIRGWAMCERRLEPCASFEARLL